MILLQLLVFLFICMSESMEIIKNDDYMGEMFPDKYLHPEVFNPTVKNIDTFIDALSKTLWYYASNANYSDANKALATYYVQVILKRTLMDDGHKLPKTQRDGISDLIQLADFTLSHYIYDVTFGKNKAEIGQYRLAQIFKDTDVLVHSLPEFNRGRLTKWIKSKGKLNEYIREMDEAVLPKEKYVELVDDSYVSYFIKIEDSDKCLVRLYFNPAPAHKNKELRPCNKDPECHQAIHASPSISYGLSHRMLNMFMYRYIRHCYWVSPSADEHHIDILCSFMYRETVYLSRKGYFARDLWLEHIALCAMMGYEEFFREHWFRKAISWMDEDGCISENRNFEINRTARFIEVAFSLAEHSEVRLLRKSLKARLSDDCHNHPMALLISVLSNAIRHAAHFLQIH